MWFAICLLATVFLDEKKAAEIVLRGCDSIHREEKTLSPEDRQQLEKMTGLRFPIAQYTFWTGKDPACGYAVVMNEIGKSEPITFMVGVDKDGRAGEIALMVFRESRGAEVREPRFTRQFKGKKLRDPIRVNQDIMNYTGATLSSEAIARGVKKALALVATGILACRHATYVMGTIATLQLYGANDQHTAAAFAELRRLDDIFTNYRDSELTRLNRSAFERPIKVSDDMFELLRLSLDYSRKYEATFDVTVGPLVRAWGFLGGTPRIPPAEECRRLRQQMGSDAIELDASRRTVRFLRPGMELDFGGIAKGYAAQKVAELLARAGVERGMVNLGESSLYALGPPPGRGSWPVTVIDTRPPHKPAAVLELPPFSALSTSGTYGRTFGPYSHLFDPRTGEPLSITASATVICRSGAESEAAAKAVLMLAPDNRAALRDVQWLRMEVRNGRLVCDRNF
jgi:thiamine biosynthesis lipoprotein